jgi:hypothetical protein
MRGIALVGIAFVGLFAAFAGFAGNAWAEDPPPPPPSEMPPPPPVVEPPPPAVPMPTDAPPAPPPPTPEERRAVVEMAPPSGTPAPSAPPPAQVRIVSPVDPCCGPQPCFQRRDDCGWAIDNCGCLYGPVDLTIEGMATWFSSPDGPLGEDVAGNTDPLDWNDIDYGTTFGGRVTLSYRYDALQRIEVRGTYWGTVDESSSREGFFGATPGDDGTGDVSRGVLADMESEAEMWGAELNWWGEVSCTGRTRVDVGFGLRYVRFEEEANVDFETVIGAPPGPFPVADGFVTSEALNQFFGAQGMVAVHIDASHCLEFYASGKGLFGQMSRDIDVSDDSIFAGGPHSSDISDDEFVFGVDFELGFKWRLSPHLAITGGYEMFFLDGVQRAEDAMDFSRSTTGAVQAVQETDQIVTHSLFLGLSINF